jgi:hypothetical protein
MQHDSLEAEILQITTLKSRDKDLVPPRLIRYCDGGWICIWRCLKDLSRCMRRLGCLQLTAAYLVQNLRDVCGRFEGESKVAFRRSESEQLE